MNENDLDIGSFEPSFLADGRGISDGQGDFPPFEQDDADWDTNAWTNDNPDVGEFRASAAGCLSDAGDPPDTGTWVLGSVNGTCQWIDTTTC